MVANRTAESGFGPSERSFLPPPPSSKGRWAKNLYTKSERLTVSCRVILAWAERVNVYNGQIIILLMKTKIYSTWSGPSNLYQLSALLLALVANTRA
jgi:hypothetical protein